MGELLLRVLAFALGVAIPFMAHRTGKQSGYKAGYEAGLMVGHDAGRKLGHDLAKLNQSGKDSARARKAAATRKQRAAIVELGNSEV